MSDQQDERTVGRRKLLRRATTVAAGIAGAGVVAGTATPAQAAAGDPVVQGATNNAGATTTTITSNADGPTLSLANSKTVVDQYGFTVAEPALHLKPSADGIAPSPVGSISMDNSGTIWANTFEYNGQTYADWVHTSGNSNRIVPIVPQRVIDTRYAASRTRIMNPTGNIDSYGRLIANKIIHVSLEDYVVVGDAVFGNATVTKSVANGFLAVWPYGVAKPANFSTVNYHTNEDLSNSFLSGIGYNVDAISLISSQTTHVIIDIVAFVVGIGYVEPAYQVAPAGAMSMQAEGTGEDARRARVLKARAAAQK